MPEKLRELLLSHGVAIAVGCVTGLLLLTMNQIIPVVLPAIEKSVPKRALLTLLVLSVLVNVLLAIYIIYQSRKSTLTPRFGVYWDRNRNAFCPVCMSLMSSYGEYAAGTGFYCTKCEEIIELREVHGDPISRESAVERLSG